MTAALTVLAFVAAGAGLFVVGHTLWVAVKDERDLTRRTADFVDSIESLGDQDWRRRFCGEFGKLAIRDLGPKELRQIETFLSQVDRPKPPPVPMSQSEG
jgi:hypothetical protein